jgi:hypothetical protein
MVRIMKTISHIGGVMVNVLISRAVDRGFENPVGSNQR